MYNSAIFGLRIPAEWRSVMLDVREIVGVNPVLSGGALRDLWYDRQIKDLDIFLPLTEDVALKMDKLHAYATSKGYVRFQNIPGYLEGMSEIQSVMGYNHPTAIELNFIFLDPALEFSAKAVAARNDFGICQIATTLGGTISEFDTVFSEAFIEDGAARTFTLLREGDIKRAMRRWERLNRKYPDFTLRTPLEPVVSP